VKSSESAAFQSARPGLRSPSRQLLSPNAGGRSALWCGYGGDCGKLCFGRSFRPSTRAPVSLKSARASKTFFDNTYFPILLADKSVLVRFGYCKGALSWITIRS